MTDNNFAFETKYGIAVIHNNSLVHLALYENWPEEVDMENLKRELATDKEFDLVGIPDLKFIIIDDVEEFLLKMARNM